MAGLDKKERLRREREEDTPEAAEPARLEPPFPYSMKPFRPTFFGLPELPEK